MSQNITPEGGGRREIQTSSTPTFGSDLSPQYQEAKKLFETPTEWVLKGRPIYWRLPSASGRYFVNFGLDEDYAYVYIPNGESTSGANSLQVSPTDDKKTLTIKSGTIVWKHGDIPVNPVVLNLEFVGMASSTYLLAYRLLYDDSPFNFLYSVEDYSLSGYTMNVGSGTDSVIGWRYQPKLAFCDNQELEWRNYDGLFPAYSGAASLYWQFPEAASFSKITLRCPSGTAVSGSASLFITNCFNPDPVNSNVPDPEDPYCQSPDWTFVETVEVQSDSQGQFFSFSIGEPSFNTGWKVEWSDPKVSISSVLVTGSLPLVRKPSSGRSNVSLVAYPVGSLPPTVTKGNGEEIEAIYCKLATIEISNDYTLSSISDARDIVNTNYQPIADWLTRPWDDNLIDLYEQVDNYGDMWMNPQTCLKQEYLKLTENLITLE